MTHSSRQGSKQYCTFIVAGQLFGIEVMQVQEILRQQVLTPVPLAPSEVAGLLNLRGQILPAIDLRRRLGFSDDGATHAVNVIYSSPDGPVDFIADQVGDVVQTDGSTWEAAPESLTGRLRDVVEGVHKLKDKLLLVLDPAKTAELAS